MTHEPAPETDSGSEQPMGDTAGTECTLCGTDLSPSEYPNCRAVMVDESGPGGDEESIRLVCEECWSDLRNDLADPTESRSSHSA